jgi:hypothetical protein
MIATAIRAAAYVAKMLPAIAGSGGHAATYAVACKLVEFGLGETEALEVFQGWNSTHCQPRWTEGELRHKLADAFRHTAPRADLAEARQSAPRWRPLPEHPTEAKRPALPAHRTGTAAEIGQLAALRGLGTDGLRLAESKGLLRFGEFKGAAAWFILDRSCRVAQARRLDGRKWGENVKAWTLTGSQATWPVGTEESAPFPIIAWCEGGPDLLAACQFILAEERAASVAPVAMLGGCSKIHPDALPHFAGKRVQIFRHLDATGDDAANRWAEQLASVGATPRAFDLAGLHRADGEPVKDLNDLALISADDFENDRALWTILP